MSINLFELDDCRSNVIRLEVLQERFKGYSRSLPVRLQGLTFPDYHCANDAIEAAKVGRVSDIRLNTAIEAVRLYLTTVTAVDAVDARLSLDP